LGTSNVEVLFLLAAFYFLSSHRWYRQHNVTIPVLYKQ